MLLKLLCVLVVVSLGDCDTSDEEFDSIIMDLLLNGDSSKLEDSDEVDDGKEPVLSGGIWKCGDCNNIDASKLIYTEVNEVDDNMITDTSVDIQIGFSLPGMQCVTVQSETAGVVRRVAGTCTSGTVTLSVAPAAHFTVNIYGS
ncbi:uncharacterized protein LOC142975411 [Anticarsia gemmatalis]|uniref:uncharacterized protein LOC142975411 n=1 Tax=Anticarsia gemmatalis TaxID=129554 RepID=UPI003F7753EF